MLASSDTLVSGANDTLVRVCGGPHQGCVDGVRREDGLDGENLGEDPRKRDAVLADCLHVRVRWGATPVRDDRPVVKVGFEAEPLGRGRGGRGGEWRKEKGHPRNACMQHHCLRTCAGATVPSLIFQIPSPCGAAVLLCELSGPSRLRENTAPSSRATPPIV